VVRFWRHFVSELSPLQQLDLPERLKKGYAALDVMEQHLATRPFFVDDRYGLADIALYGYTHVATKAISTSRAILTSRLGLPAWSHSPATSP